MRAVDGWPASVSSESVQTIKKSIEDVCTLYSNAAGEKNKQNVLREFMDVLGEAVSEAFQGSIPHVSDEAARSAFQGGSPHVNEEAARSLELLQDEGTRAIELRSDTKRSFPRSQAVPDEIDAAMPAGGAAGPVPTPASTPGPKILLTLLAVVKSHIGTLVWLQLCNPQCVALYTFVQLLSRVSRPLAGAPVYDMSLKHAERLRMVGSGLKGKLVRLLALGVGSHFEPTRNWGACRRMMQIILRHAAAGMAAAVRDNVAKEAEKLCASGKCAAALPLLQQAIDLGHLPSLALKAWMLIKGRESVAEDRVAVVELASRGMGLGCHHCQGVMAYCHGIGTGNGTTEHPICVDEELSLQLAMQSSAKGSRYGQQSLGELLRYNTEHVVDLDSALAVMHFRLAAAQGLDEAQCSLGFMYRSGKGVTQDYTEALRWFQLAAAQGLPVALFNVAVCHARGEGVPEDREQARLWYMRAHAAGHAYAADTLRNLTN